MMLFSVASATAILHDIYCYEDYYGGAFCFKNNTIFPSVLTNTGTGKYRSNSLQPIIINGSLKVNDNITAKSFNGNWSGSSTLMENSSNISCSYSYTTFKWNCFFNGTAGSGGADYEFGANNFNGSGNSSTTGTVRGETAVHSMSLEKLTDYSFDDTGIWEGWTTTGNGFMTRIGAPSTATEIVPFPVEAGVDYLIEVGVIDNSDSDLDVAIGGVEVQLYGDVALGLDNTVYSTVIHTTDTTEFSIGCDSGSANVQNLSYISVKKKNSEVNDLGDSKMWNLVVLNQTTMKDLDVTGEFSVSELFVDGGFVGSGAGGYGVNITTQSASPGGSSKKMHFRTGDGPGAGTDPDMEFYTGTGSHFGNFVFMNGKVLINTKTELTNNGTGLEVNGNVTITGAYGVKSPTFDLLSIDNVLDSSQLKSEILLNEDDKLSDEILFDDEYDYLSVYDKSCTEQQINDNKCPTHLERTTWASTIAVRDRVTIIKLNQEIKMLKGIICKYHPLEEVCK